MKNPNRVTELLAELRKLADNDFERHRIDVLEQDLTAPPVVEVIDDVNQKFCDFTYRKQKHGGHYCENLPIHRAVWAYYNGEIPDGCEIHHRDTNKSNNDISNLQCLTKAEHRRLHNLLTGEKPRICPACGKEFFPKAGHIHGKFCCSNCQSKVYNDLHPVTRNCAWCGQGFSCAPGVPTQCCSHKCAGKLWRSQKDKPEKPPKYCAVCGKQLPNNYRPEQKYCSRSCAWRAIWAKKKSLE